MSAIIKVENLGKKYILKHQNTERYTALRDVISNKAKNILNPKSQTINPKSEEFWALNDISFEVNQGDRVGIIGRNGAGKSTLLKILSRIVTPTKGRITLDGRVASLLEVGTGFHPELTGRENIFLNGAILGMGKSEIKRKFDEIVDFAEVEKFLDTPVKRYSSGMYVRLAFAVAANLEPEILIVDEVLAVGDAAFQKKCMGKMKNVSNEGRTVLFVSHNMVSIEALCDRALVLDNGMISYSGSINDAIKSYVKSISVAEINTSLINSSRSGNGKLKFTKVIFYDETMSIIPAPITGKKLIIALEYETFSKDIGNIKVGIAINNSIYGNQITALVNDISGSSFSTVAANGIFICEIPKLTLVSGQYSLNLFCSVNGDISDWMVNILNFNVIAGDFYGTGRNMDSGQSQFLMDYSWYCNEKN